MNKYQILLTNDDGIESPGLRAAVAAAVQTGNVTVVAPSHQQTATGRGLTGNREASLTPINYKVNGVDITAYHCDCSPALIIKHSLATLFPHKKPELLISGINYGENLGTNITSSGTIGAALEAASFGIPAIAISKQTDIASHQKYTDQDWQVSAYFLKYFSKLLLTKKMPHDVNVLKIDIPQNATTSTQWKVTKLSNSTYYSKVIENPSLLSKICDAKTEININRDSLLPETDIFAFSVERVITVTPLSVDLTSRTSFSGLQKILSKEEI